MYRTKKQRELSYWVDKPQKFNANYIKDDMEEFVNNHQSFTNHGSGIGVLMIFLSARFSMDGEYFAELSSPEFDHIKINMEDNKKSLNRIMEQKKKELEDKFKRKYMVNEYSIRKQMA